MAREFRSLVNRKKTFKVDWESQVTAQSFLTPIDGLPMVKTGDDLCAMISKSLSEAQIDLASGDTVAVTVSLIIGEQAVKGSAAKMMKELGKDVSLLGIARHYCGLIDGLVITAVDAGSAAKIENMGISVRLPQTLMSDVQSKIDVSKFCLNFASEFTR
jgi:hypothetical protein